MKKILLTTLLMLTVAFASNKGFAAFKAGFLNGASANPSAQAVPAPMVSEVGNWTETFETSIGTIDHTAEELYIHWFSIHCKDFVRKISISDDRSPPTFVSLHWNRTRDEFIEELKTSDIFLMSVADSMAEIEAEIKAAQSSVKGELANWTESFETKAGTVTHTPTFVNLGGCMQSAAGVHIGGTFNGVPLTTPLLC